MDEECDGGWIYDECLRIYSFNDLCADEPVDCNALEHFDAANDDIYALISDTGVDDIDTRWWSCGWWLDTVREGCREDRCDENDSDCESVHGSGCGTGSDCDSDDE